MAWQMLREGWLKKLEDNFGQLTTQIDAERDARQMLEERVRQLEKRPPLPSLVALRTKQLRKQNMWCQK